MNSNLPEKEHMENQAFGRNARLRNRWQLDEMRAAGQKEAGRFCVVIIHKTPPDGMRRAAFLISRRYSLNAVDRNRARRLFREAFRSLYGQLPPSWILFVPRQRMKNARLADIMADLAQMLPKFGLNLPAAGVPASQVEVKP